MYPHIYGAKQSETIIDWQRHGHEPAQLKVSLCVREESITSKKWGENSKWQMPKVGYSGQIIIFFTPILKVQNVYNLSLQSESGSDPAMFRMLWRVCAEIFRLRCHLQVKCMQLVPHNMQRLKYLSLIMYIFKENVLVNLLDYF